MRLRFIFIFTLALILVGECQVSNYYKTGITIANEFRINYEEGENITFNANYSGVAGMSYSSTWNFYSSDTKALLRTSGGNSFTTTFTHAQGKNGIDVELFIDYGINRTRFYKRRRVVIMPDCSVPTLSINLATLPSEQIDLSGVSPGSIVRLYGNRSSTRIKIVNAPNALTNPVILLFNSPVTLTKTGTSYDDLLQIDNIVGGTPINGLWIYSKKDGSGNPYLTMTGGGIGCRTGTFNSHNNIRVSGVKITDAQSSGIKLKGDDAQINRFRNGFDDLWVYDNDVSTSINGNEGTYIGHEAQYGYRYDADFGDYNHTVKRAKIFANYFHDCGYDGFQITCADEDTEIHDNVSVRNGSANVFAQDFAMSAAGGFSGQIFNNIFDRPIQVFGNGNTYVYNNYISGETDAGIDNAIFIRRYDNPGIAGPNGDSYNHVSPTAKLFIFNNYIKANKDAVYNLNGNDGGTGNVPFAELYYFNNTILMVGTPVTGDLRYQGTAPTTQIKDNFLPASSQEVKVYNESGIDLATKQNSKVLYGANEGIDVTQYIPESDLKVGYTDITGQSYPVNGIFRQYMIQRYKGFIEPSPLSTQYQWYKTAQTSVFSDKEKLTDMFSSVVRTYTAISSSSKSRLLMSVKPVSKNNRKSNETFNTGSN